MQLTNDSALWRVLTSCVKMFRKTPRDTAATGTALPPLTAHIARDIGLTPSEVEHMRHRWPSQSTQHPYL